MQTASMRPPRQKFDYRLDVDVFWKFAFTSLLVVLSGHRNNPNVIFTIGYFRNSRHAKFMAALPSKVDMALAKVDVWK